MLANLDNQAYFDEGSFKLQVKSVSRETVEKSAAGLDGAVSIDLGRRKRKLLQTGKIIAANLAELGDRTAAVEKLFDGQLRTLFSPDGRVFEDVVIESFSTDEPVIAAAAVSCGYKIVYCQLG